jgi:hypothetical protein
MGTLGVDEKLEKEDFSSWREFSVLGSQFSVLSLYSKRLREHGSVHRKTSRRGNQNERHPSIVGRLRTEN